MRKVQREYNRLYGSIPNTRLEMLDHMIKNMKIKKGTIKEINRQIEHINSLNWKQISIIIYAIPKACPRPRNRKGSHVFYVSDAKDNREDFIKFISNIRITEDIEYIYTPTKFECISFFPIPKSMKNSDKISSELGFIYNISNPDWDNIGKTYSDMVKSDLMIDDNIIFSGQSIKRYSYKPRIEINISYLNDFDCKYNEIKIKKRKGWVNIDEQLHNNK